MQTIEKSNKLLHTIPDPHRPGETYAVAYPMSNGLHMVCPITLHAPIRVCSVFAFKLLHVHVVRTLGSQIPDTKCQRKQTWMALNTVKYRI